MKHFLIIQTAFIGDVILATPLIEKLYQCFPDAKIDFLLRKGNESLLTKHPKINKVIIWDKKQNKYKNLFSIIKQIRKNRYDYVINIQRFASTGIITAFSGGKIKIGFDKNPLSFLFDFNVKHPIGNNIHEVERNLSLIEKITKLPSERSEFTSTIDLNLLSRVNYQIIKLPKLYPSEEDFDAVKIYKDKKYICIAPASVWFTKQFPKEKWIDFIQQLDSNYNIFLLGGKDDFDFCNSIINKPETENRKPGTIKNLAGKLTFLRTAALMKDAMMNYVNDSAPLHLASAVNAPVTAVFCSTVPGFGFGPLSEKSFIVETEEKLECRPCGLHGFKQCPLKHFNCANSIKTEQLLKTLL